MRGVIKFVLTLILVVALAWLGLWWYAQGRLQNGFQAWAEQQATHGVTVAYAGLQRGTSPTEASLAISNLTVTLPQTTNGTQAVITLPSLVMRIEAASPTVLHVDFPNKITVNAGGNLDLAINSGGIAASETLDPNALFNKNIYPFRAGDFSATNVDFLASSGSLLVLHVDSFTGHANINPNAGAGDTALGETLTLNGMALSPLMTRIASVPFGGKIDQLTTTIDLSGPVPPQIYTLPDQIRAAQHDTIAQQKLVVPIIHQWASAGGSGSIGLTLAIGPSTASANAAVKFDANLQPEGTANATANHLDQFTAAIVNAYPQLQDNIAAAEAQLTPYITTTGPSGQTLTIHTTYGAGAVTINGTKVTTLPNINWTTLENPTPAPVPATPSPGQ
jgi:hypothetical protein